jgi:glutamyl-tRNA reductase
LAFETAKKIRTETALGEKSVSVVSLGLEHLRETQDKLKIEQAVVVGRGPTSLSVIHWLQKNLPQVPITWVNRNLEVLDQFSESMVVKKVSLEAFLKSPSQFTHLFTATSSVEPIFNEDFFSRLDPNKKIVFDFAQPADVGQIQNNLVEVVRLEHLQKEAQENRQLRAESVLQAEKMIEDALKTHILEQKETPVIRDFSQIETVFEDELARAFGFIEKDYPAEFHGSLKKLAEAIVKKNLHLSREHLRTVLRRVADIGPDPLVV